MTSFPKPGPSVRRNPGPTRKEKEAARDTVWARCGGFCEKCKRPVIYERGEWASMHTAHIQGGIHRDNWDPETNLLGLCLWCHSDMHNEKSVPPKERG